MLAALMGAAAWAEPALPLESESFTVDVAGSVAEIVFHQTFRNRTTSFVDAFYVFPLDNDAVVDSMVVSVAVVASANRDRTCVTSSSTSRSK